MKAAEARRDAMHSFNPHQQPLKVNDKTGQILYQAGASKVDVAFDGRGKNLPPFLAQLDLRSKKCAWDSILTFGAGADARHVLKHCRQIADAQVQEAHSTFLCHQGHPDHPTDDAVPGFANPLELPCLSEQ